MTTKERFETAEKIAEIINGNAWCPDHERDNAPVRVYLQHKWGYAIVADDGINIHNIKRAAFQDVKDSLVAAGYNCYRA